MTRQRRLWLAAAGTWAVVAAGAWPSQPAPAVTAASAQVEIATAPRISVADFKKLFASGDVVVLDVRSADAYTRGHIPGAVLVPEASVESRAGEWLKEKRPIVTYCT
jgi:3-mercaptopyruvate sulfurtransferase SseA